MKKNVKPNAMQWQIMEKTIAVIAIAARRERINEKKAKKKFQKFFLWQNNCENNRKNREKKISYRTRLLDLLIEF